jgi:hypothetical protein
MSLPVAYLPEAQDDLDVAYAQPEVVSCDLASVTGEVSLLFQHLEAATHFGASVFWTRRAGAIGGEQAMIEHWQVRREGGQRGIIEIVPEGA